MISWGRLTRFSISEGNIGSY
uniref:Uncharacterized protein n=1 Tax=Arundo donax TaxID=35708 RepID=A0A0A9H5A1_ARUDO